MNIGFVGGTGPAGIGLAERMAAAGHHVLLGSRTVERAEATREVVVERVPSARVEACDNATAVIGAEVIFLTVPFDAQRATVEGLAKDLDGKIVVSISNPIRVVDKRPIVETPEAGSLAEETAHLVPGARVVGALHEIRVSRLSDFSHPINADTIVTGDDEDAKKIVMRLVQQIPGIRAVDGGSLANSRYVEGFVAVLVSINFRYKAGASYRITGLR
jgi:NADPH-dependent F420 reductase